MEAFAAKVAKAFIAEAFGLGCYIAMWIDDHGMKCEAIIKIAQAAC